MPAPTSLVMVTYSSPVHVHSHPAVVSRDASTYNCITTKFDAFWSEMAKYFDDIGVIPVGEPGRRRLIKVRIHILVEPASSNKLRNYLALNQEMLTTKLNHTMIRTF